MKNNNLLIIAVILLAVAVIVYITMDNDDKNRKYDWQQTFEDGDRQPYDLGLIKKLLINKSDQFEVVTTKLSDKLKAFHESDSATYLFIGQYCFYTKAEIDELLRFAETGRQVVLIAEHIPDTLMLVLQEYGKPFKIDQMVLNNVNVYFNNDSSIYKSHTFRYRYFDKDMNQSIPWNYISEEEQLDYYFGTTSSRYLRLGFIEEKLNFAKFRHGKGQIFLHTNPLLFTNYFVSTDTGFAYAGQVFAELETTHVLYDVGSREYKEDATRTMRKSDSPLSYILKQPSLKWAWYLLIIATLCFFLFKAKREQRIIAVLEQKRNTSLNFVETISGLYFNYKDHKKMTVIKMNLFTGFIRQKLGIPTNNITEEVIQQISTKAKVPLHDTSIIFYYYDKLIQAQKTIDADDLINLNTYIETFYKYYNAKK
jgi:hypothetical protein